MPKLIIIVFLIIIFIVVIMFLFLKNAVSSINKQSKQYFINKLQVYDDIIEQKEQKLKEIKEEIKSVAKDQDEVEIKQTDAPVEFDYSTIINQTQKADYKVDNLLQQLKKVDELFSYDYKEVILQFIKDNYNTSDEDKKKYEMYKKIKTRFDFNFIYSLTILDSEIQYNKIKDVLGEYDYILDKFDKRTFNILEFNKYIDKQIEESDPNIYIYVGRKNENYNALNENIVTKLDDNIYKGIIIVYRGKLTDHSLNQEMK